MQLKKTTIQELKKIIKNDYGVLLNDDKAIELGSSLLKLTRLALGALARTDEKKRLASSGKSELHS